MIAQLTAKENTEVTEAYTALFNMIQGFPVPLRHTWWSGAYRTLDHATVADILEAIKVYGENAQRAHERYMKRVQS